MGDADTAVLDYGLRLLDALRGAISPWVVGSVKRVMDAQGAAWTGEVATAAERAGVEATDDLVPQLEELLRQDVDRQATTPLTILRGGIRYPARVLAGAGAAPVARDRDAAARFPEDAYDLTPAAFADFGPEVAEAGLAWGAAKAFVHRERHRG